MPRLVQRPTFPDTPGRWLACYRYRWQPEGRACSPEQLGSTLGVSGTTVRRWEAGQLRPTRDDLLRFARTCELNPLEEHFLVNAFQNRETETGPTRRQFVHLANQALVNDHPAFLMDSLFYIRARNSYMEAMVPNGLTPITGNALEGAFGNARQAPTPPPLRLMRSFWLSTAGLSGSPTYRALLRGLRTVEGFEEAWWHLAMTSDATSDAINLPMDFTHREHGTYRVFVSRLVLPPVYYLREYVPQDDVARSFVASLRRSPAEVHAAENHHWA
ncbi:MAG TPA: helix-turn-helix transcriptional regulator [Dehalococcoidia bacterium]|nr:helix-turn-helix transcriptional regulator [Dehalococcoidia bacterium]